jgi:hypothetical protein
MASKLNRGRVTGGPSSWPGRQSSAATPSGKAVPRALAACRNRRGLGAEPGGARRPRLAAADVTGSRPGRRRHRRAAQSTLPRAGRG